MGVGSNRGYWAPKAVEHTAQMSLNYGAQIQACVNNTSIHRLTDADLEKIKVQLSANDINSLDLSRYNIKIVPTDTVDAAFTYQNGLTCMLNFASYKGPGGQFLTGSYAQEEALCHESFLYNVLSQFRTSYYDVNCKDLNHGFYRHAALYSPSVLFIREPKNAGEQQRVGYFDVLTCAAPCFLAGRRYGNQDKAQNSRELFNRTGFMLLAAGTHNVNTLILGAWGCGVFAQDPIEVCYQILRWLDALRTSLPIKNIIFAIPGRNSKNYLAFESVLSKYNLA